MRTKIIIRIITVIGAMLMACTSAWFSGYFFGQAKGFEEGKQEGFHAGRLHQILEECKELLDKKLKSNKEESNERKQETTEN